MFIICITPILGKAGNLLACTTTEEFPLHGLNMKHLFKPKILTEISVDRESLVSFRTMHCNAQSKSWAIGCQSCRFATSGFASKNWTMNEHANYCNNFPTFIGSILRLKDYLSQHWNNSLKWSKNVFK